MAEVVIEVHNITTAGDWIFSAPHGDRPILCLALVSTMDTVHPTLAPARRIIALDEFDILGDLIGMNLEEKHWSIEKQIFDDD